MPHAQFDDRYDDHRKIKRAWRTDPAAVGLHAMAITYCSRHKTDGLVHGDWVDEKLALSSLKPRQQQATIDRLLEVGLFEREGDDYRVHDFLDWNRSRAQREALAEQGRRGGHAKAKANDKPPDSDGSGPGSSHGYSEGQSEGQAPAKPLLANGSSTPRHATPSQAKEQHVAASPPLSEQDRQLEERVAYLSHLLSAEVRMAHGIAERSREALPVKGWHDACRSMLKLDDFSADQVEFAIRWVCRHHYWRHRVKSMPRLRSEMEQVVAEIRKQRDGGQVVPLRSGRQSPSDLLRSMAETEAAERVPDAEVVDDEEAS